MLFRSRDLGLVKFGEPAKNLLTQGMVLNHIYSRHPAEGRRQFFDPAQVTIAENPDGSKRYCARLADGESVEVQYDGLGTMSKSRNNGVDPQDLVERFGADTVRLYSMFTAPPEQTMLWSDEGVEGSFRFIRRLWTAVHAHVQAGPASALEVAALNPEQKSVRRATHQTLAKVTDDIGRRHTFNTAIAAVMELLNTLGRFDDASAQGRAVRQEALSTITVCLAPIVPHVCHTLWQLLGHEGALIDAPWPHADAAAQVQDEIELSVQVNGKMRARVAVAASADEATVRAAVLADERVRKFVGDATPRKVIYVPGKLVNVVV